MPRTPQWPVPLGMRGLHPLKKPLQTRCSAYSRTTEKPSKRMTCRKRYKIAKKIREHNRKKRKESKRIMNKPLKKLIHVPNICPFKADILKSVAEFKKQKEIEQEENRKLLIESKKEKPKDFAEIVSAAQLKQISFDEEMKEDNVFIATNNNNGKPKSYREFQKVIASADVILEVVDARDPLGTRCSAVEQCVRNAADGKRLVLILNKADLVPRKILDQWLKFLRKSVPAIPFKSSTQTQNKHLGRRKLKKNQEIGSNSVCIGAEGLTSLLANYTRNKGIKTSIRVGVVGLPNVGKSSLINSLKRSRACKVGAIPGVTRTLQEVQLDSKIKLLDSPGLAFAKSSDPHAALKNAVLSTDSIEPAEMIIARVNKEELKNMYLVSDFSSHNEFLVSLAKRFGRYKKGGIPDMNAAAKILVDDWNRGKISYYAQPPEEDLSHEISSCIVTTDVPEFDLESYDKNVSFEMEIDKSNESQNCSQGVLIVTSKEKRRKKKKQEVERKKDDSLMKLEGNQRLNKINKLKMKKIKKNKARTERSTQKLADTTEKVNLINHSQMQINN